MQIGSKLIMKMYNRFSLWIILISSALTIATGSILAPALNLIREGLGVDPASAGFIITTHGLFTALFSPLIGNLIDKIGAKKPLVFGLLFYGLTGSSGLIITSYWVLIIGRAILGIGVAIVLNSATVMILNLYKETERNKVMGWQGSANTLSSIIFLLIGGFLGLFSWRMPFVIYLLGIPLSLFALLTIPEIHTNKQDINKGSSVSKIFKNNPILFVIYSIYSLSIILLYTIIIFLPQLLEEIGISNPVYISLFIAALALSGGITSFMYGKIKSRLSYKMIVLTVFGLWAGAFTVISLGFSSQVIAGSVVLCGIGQGMLFPAVMVWAGEIVDVSFRGRIISYLTTFGYVGQFLSPLVFSPVVLLLGLNSVFLVAGGCCVVLCLIVSFGMRK